MHDWNISIMDGKVQKTDNGCVKTFKIEIENDDVYIVVKKNNQIEKGIS
jgi:nitrite reductase (NADH) small subunit